MPALSLHHACSSVHHAAFAAILSPSFFHRLLACIRRLGHNNLEELLASFGPETAIVCLQETKMVQGQLDASLAKPAGTISQYHIVQRRIRIVSLVKNSRTNPDDPERQDIDAVPPAGWERESSLLTTYWSESTLSS